IFLFQAEDGIRDATVTGVQTCALPIWDSSFAEFVTAKMAKTTANRQLPLSPQVLVRSATRCSSPAPGSIVSGRRFGMPRRSPDEIGRASCREGGEAVWVGGEVQCHGLE